MEEFVLKGVARTEFGSKAARRYRDAGYLPANIYGHEEDNLAINLDAGEFRGFFDAGHRVATIHLGDSEEHGVIKEVQYDALGSTLVHVDFSRIGRDETISVEVPVSTVGVPKGVSGGGVLETPRKEIRVEGPAAKVPERIELNIVELKVGDVIRVRDLDVPQGCRILDDGEQVVATVTQSREELEAEIAEATGDEPEVIGRKKPEDEETDG
ncbi:MAG: 50S ribosomal protein L25 [Planctomycetota bacterium]|nr:50S ribosomal protein L25 [Planctomycetota bacterium]